MKFTSILPGPFGRQLLRILVVAALVIPWPAATLCKANRPTTGVGIERCHRADIEQEIEELEYRASRPAFGLQAPNRKQDLRFWFEDWGVRVEPRVDASGEDLVAIRTSGFGRAGLVASITPGEVVADAARVELRREEIVEWYRNSEAGLEHGYGVETRPAGQGDLIFEIEFDGATVSVADDRATIRTATGRLLGYSHLAVTDSYGANLPARLQAASNGAVRIVVDDSNARYPIVVNPLLSSIVDTILFSTQEPSDFGASVAGAGDLNGDGYDDIVVGARLFDLGELDEGAAFVFHGGPSGIANGDETSAAATLQSDVADAHFGSSVAIAGDVNGDGYDDVVIGAEGFADGELNEGAAFVFHGGPTGVGNGTMATADAFLQSNQTQATFGSSVAGAGDVNGDGYADVIVGAFTFTLGAGEDGEGGAFVFHGSAAGIPSGSLAAASATIQSNQIGANLGASVSSAGDVNADGYADVIIGAHGWDEALMPDIGLALIFHGGPSGVGNGDRANADAVRTGFSTDELFGWNVRSSGDVNGDDYADVLISSGNYSNGEGLEGAVFVFHGSSSGIGNGDASTAATTLQGNQMHAGFGSSVSGAGDVNADGFADVTVAAPGYSNGQFFEGAVFVYHGSAAGISSGDPASADSTIEFDIVNGQLGDCVASAGDVDGDGNSDVVVGSNFFDTTGNSRSAVLIVQGGADVGGADGSDTAGIYVSGTGAWFLRNSNSPGPGDVVFGYGPAGLGWVSLAGDWDGDGDDTVGLYDPATGNFFLKNSNVAGGADLVYGFGQPGLGWIALSGDWDGDGDDTIGLYDPINGFFYLRNTHAPGWADVVYGFGPAGLGWVPITGDWNKDNVDTIGLYDPSTGTFFLRNVHAGGPADLVYGFGPAGLGWIALSGDWDGDGDDTVGLYDPVSTNFFLRNSHAPGEADVVFGYGPAGVVPVVGDWDGL
ncbi:MAG: FG-GAP repeat protein [Acidobacteria bacterium]|nr:FG-GAP repeat protein [Acidobacteriota bacterium]